jgi:hypothetical protein
MKARNLVLLAAAVAALALPVSAWGYYTYFDFARQSNIASALTMVWQPLPGKFSTVSWRAGSGTSTDACWIGHGWLPSGWYDLNGHWDNYNGSSIRGRVFYLQNKPCWNGTWRTELFVHSEETADQGQYCPSVYDDPFCWEGDSDYYSNGCIKLSRAGSPSDLRLMHDGWHSRSGDYRHGSFWINDWLYVHD